MYKAKFKTAYLQREIPIDAVVVGGDPLVVGEVLVVDFAANGLAIVQAVSANSVEEAADKATHILAQSDQTMSYGHIPVENRDYRYSPEVAVTVVGDNALPNFDGFYDSLDELNSALGNGVSGHTALVKHNGEYNKYTSNGNTWSNSNVVAGIKKVAVFAIVDKTDVVIYDAEA